MTARNLDKELATPAGKKLRSEELLKTKKAALTGVRKIYATTAMALRPSSFVPQNYTHHRVIIEGSARLVQEDKVKEFLDLAGTTLSNGKMVDRFFVIVLVNMGSGRKDLKEVRDIPSNMTLMGGYIKILEKSLWSFERKNLTRINKGGKSARGETVYNNNMIYLTLAIACDVEPTEILSGILVEWMRVGGIWL